jgi:hypothetical protein
MMHDAWYVSDSGELTCDDCTLEAVKYELRRAHSGHGDAAGRILAVIRLEDPSDMSELHKLVGDLDGWPNNGNNRARNRDAVRFMHELVCPISFDGSESNYGESCGGCSEVLCDSWTTCENCGEGDWTETFGFAEGPFDHVDAARIDGPAVSCCASCEDDYAAEGTAVLLADDGRGYTLRFWPTYVGPINAGRGVATEPTPVYAAGCRRFTLDYALQHWGPGHHSQRHADVLFAAVLAHGMRRALPNIVLADDRW